MLLGVGEPESWLKDCSPPPAAWELPPTQGEELEGELGSLEEVGEAFTEPSPTVSSLGSWADECERADAPLAAAEAQMCRRCLEENLEGDTALAGDLLEEENWAKSWSSSWSARDAPHGRRQRAEYINSSVVLYMYSLACCSRESRLFILILFGVSLLTKKLCLLLHVAISFVISLLFHDTLDLYCTAILFFIQRRMFISSQTSFVINSHIPSYRKILS